MTLIAAPWSVKIVKVFHDPLLLGRLQLQKYVQKAVATHPSVKSTPETISGIEKDFPFREHCKNHSHEAQNYLYDYMKRFQQMCKECRYAWNEKVDYDQKLEIRKKLQVWRAKFEEMMDNEIQILQKHGYHVKVWSQK